MVAIGGNIRIDKIQNARFCPPTLNRAMAYAAGAPSSRETHMEHEAIRKLSCKPLRPPRASASGKLVQFNCRGIQIGGRTKNSPRDFRLLAAIQRKGNMKSAVKPSNNPHFNHSVAARFMRKRAFFAPSA